MAISLAASPRFLLLFLVPYIFVFVHVVSGLPRNQDENGSRSKSSLEPLDLVAAESKTDEIEMTTPADEVAMESRSKNEQRRMDTDDSSMTDGGADDSSQFEVELMTGDEADVSESEDGFDETAEGVDRGEDAMEDEEDDVEDDTSPQSQHLFPSFTSLFPPLGHSRPATFFTEPPPPPPPPRTFQTESFHRALYSTDESDRVLGSGNFGVIRGGTYYSGNNDDLPFIRGPNSHSRPYRRPNPLPQYRHGGDFFAGFKDFADITTPAKPSFSQIYVVYANRNSTSNDNNNNSGRPKNIRELLEADTEEKIKSKSKKKLNLYKEKVAAVEASKKYRGLNKDFGEPLLALS